MSDAEIRLRQRAEWALTAAGVQPSDAEVEARETMERRYSSGPYDHLVGKWVLIYGVVNHFRGLLLHVWAVGGGKHKLALWPLYNMADFTDESSAVGEGEHLLEGSSDCPRVLSDDVIQEIGLQPRAWKKS